MICIGGQLKGFNFLFCATSVAKGTKDDKRYYTEWLQNSKQKETRPILVFIGGGKVQKDAESQYTKLLQNNK